MVFVCGFGNVNSFRGICYFEYCLDCSRARDELNCGVSVRDWGNCPPTPPLTQHFAHTAEWGEAIQQ